MIQLRLICFCIRMNIVSDHHSRSLNQARFNCIIKSEITHDPTKQRFLRVFLTRGIKWGCTEIVTAEDVSGLMNAIQTSDPHCSFVCTVLQVPTAKVFTFGSYVDPPGVMSFIIDHQYIAGIGHLSQYFSTVCFIAFHPAFVH